MGSLAKFFGDALNAVSGLFDHKHHKTTSSHQSRGLPNGNVTFEAIDAAFGPAVSRTFVAAALGNSSTPAYYTGLAGVNLDMDRKLVVMLWLTIAATVFVVFSIRLAQLFVSYIRTTSCMRTDKPNDQNYFSVDHFSFWEKLKKHLIYAPLGKKRHNRELQLHGGAVSYGTLPSRIHTLIMGVYSIMTIIYCLILDYSNTQNGAIWAELRGRSGILATVNLIPLIVLAQRNNLAIRLLKVSFDTFNLFHRWLGRLVAMLSLIHFFAWLAAYKLDKGKDATIGIFKNAPFLDYGLLGLVAILILPLHSLSFIRHAFYETFLHLHQSLAFLALLGIYVHLDVMHLPAYPAVLIAVLLWAGERIWRIGRIIRLNYSRGYGVTFVIVEALPGDACRVTFQLPRRITIRPGSHMYAYLPSISGWMSHPFSAAWTNIESEPAVAGHDLVPQRPSTPSSLERQSVMDMLKDAPTSVSLVMVAREGMTRKLYDKARAAPEGHLQLRGFLEGPYAGHDSLVSYGTVVMFAGGGGITHHLIQIRHLIAGARAHTVATRRIVLVWSIKDVECMEWVKPWMNEILHMEGRREVLMIKVHVSKPTRRIDHTKSKPTMQIVQGRCDPGAVLDEILPTRIGATMVSVCGPGALADEVRAAVRSRIHRGNLELNEESFTW
ncbi:hypothetical protein H2200_000150 [Cladophialophora chaetospira]|uniref:FAD-binding FR-type domain-containing protein n=1 Tax=Cladophialophora chaetospira TaxID=386627 RepID=A0AA38XMZ8_9EURO|nr:hypothetical protein H2200_000150 [Cladophialophora chaetospira]